ncbi:MAG: hypothetical protein ABNH00_13510 [Dokdonia sp.]|jgi:hypothetical protein|nr:hypothetical protein [Cytophagaceae bacterium]|tara:strand:+ start:155 stop:1093 length:939 start_codon:yes stop_codon:yes gene_type:complete
MKSSQLITFRKERELGQIIGDTFKFIRKNGKSLWRLFLRTSMLPFIVLLAAVAYYTYASTGVNTLSLQPSGVGDYDLGAFIISIIALLLGIIWYSAALYGSVSEYIKNYVDHDGFPILDEVVNAFKQKMGNYIGLGFAQVFFIIFACILAFLPGAIIINSSGFMGGILFFAGIFPVIYLAIRWLLVFQTMAHSDTTIVASFTESGRLIKDFWWITFATIIVQGLLMYAISIAFQMPLIVYMFAKGIIMAQEGSLSDPSSMFDWGFVALQTLSSGISYLMYIILVITHNLIFFNLNERKTQSGSLAKIDTLGN